MVQNGLSELLQNIHDVIAVAITDENIKDKPLDGMSIAPIQNMDSARYPDFVAHIMNDLSETDLTSLSSRLQSRHYRGQTISLEISSLQKVTIVVVSNDGNMSLKF